MMAGWLAELKVERRAWKRAGTMVGWKAAMWDASMAALRVATMADAMDEPSVGWMVPWLVFWMDETMVGRKVMKMVA